MATDHRRILILCKTYPSPSSRYVETSCVAGMDEEGHLVRLFPVPFRLIEDSQQFRKWQWIRARVRPSRLLGLDITPVDTPDWTEEEKAKL